MKTQKRDNERRTIGGLVWGFDELVQRGLATWDSPVVIGFGCGENIITVNPTSIGRNQKTGEVTIMNMDIQNMKFK